MRIQTASFWVGYLVGMGVANLIWLMPVIGVAHADHGGPTFEHECPLPDGDPRGWPCTHTMPNGQKYVDWSYTYIDDRRYLPVGAP